MRADLAGYARLGKIASGGSGVVYLVRDPRQGNLAAAKTLFRQHAADPARREGFRRECEAHGATRHPHLPTRLAAAPEAPAPALVLELLRGVPLSAAIDHHPLAAPAACTLGAAVAGALARLHQAGWVHRDVKPSNVFLTHEGRPVLVDLGAAAPTPTKDPGPLSLLYAAPEVLGGAPATPASDLFSLGVTLYEAVTGMRPFEGATAPAVLANHATPPAPVHDLAPGIPGEVAARIEALLARDPAARPPDAWTVEQDLTRGLARLARHPEDPGDPVTRQALRVRVLALDAAGHPGEAEALLRQLEDADPTDPWVPWVASRLARHRGQPVAGVEALARAEALGLPPRHLAEARGRAYLQAGRFLEAHAAFAALVEDDPTDRVAQVLRDWLEQA